MDEATVSFICIMLILIVILILFINVVLSGRDVLQDFEEDHPNWEEHTVSITMYLTRIEIITEGYPSSIIQEAIIRSLKVKVKQIESTPCWMLIAYA